MYRRFVSSLKKLILVMVAGIAYHYIFSAYGVAIPCFFNKVTGLLCPGCGITRMLSAAFKGEFAIAYGYNKFLFITFPIIIIIWGSEEIRYIKNGQRKMSRFSELVLSAEIVFLIIFGILRNVV